MSPLLVVSVTACMGLALCNLAWSGYARSLRARSQRLDGALTELRAETKAEVSAALALRTELGSLSLRIQDLTRGIFPGLPLPGTLADCLDRVEESIQAQRKSNRTVRRQLSRTVNRLRASQQENQRLQRQARSQPGDLGAERDLRAQLMETRQEVEDMRLQLRSAYLAIADLETQLALTRPLAELADGGEPTEMMA